MLIRFLPLVAALIALTLPSLALAQDTLRTITVNGRGEVSVPPDMATVNLGVRAEAPDTGSAMDQASAATAAILATLAAAGIEGKDIQSGTIRLSPVYGSSLISGARQITGYTATNAVNVRVLDLAGLGTLLQAVVGDGANSLNGVQFGLQDPQEHEDAARRLAVADAARRAALYADAGGVALGDMISLNEQGTAGYAPLVTEQAFDRSISAASYEVPIAAGEIDLSASVIVIYEIGAGE